MTDEITRLVELSERAKASFAEAKELAEKLGKCELHVSESRFFHGNVLVPTHLLARVIAGLRADAERLHAILAMWEVHCADLDMDDANQSDSYDSLCALLDAALKEPKND